MQFITNGPDIPEALLNAQEEGRLIFFAGAGISYPAGLPDFKGLVDKIYDEVGTTQNDFEKEAYDSEQYDTTLDLLEHRLPGQRLPMRKALFNVLQPDLQQNGATETHAALLELASNRDGTLRLVTTNFDRIFEHVIQQKQLDINRFPAPLLPIPKPSRWNGLVYLHGLLPENVNDKTALNQLILTSGDFGLAYLVERWAARFVSELFRNYVVCFVGYSLNDPVLRYMMDALAADRMLGETTPQAYAFVAYEPDQQITKTKEWKAKGIIPILYSELNEHAAFHNTLKVWAETYRDGVFGKERIVLEYAQAKPSASTKEDDFISRMLWAISDPSGLPAKRFAEMNPVPPLEWLKIFSEERYRYADLIRFGIQSDINDDPELKFSLINRPASYTHTPWMSLVSAGARCSVWDKVLFHLASWLTRHLNDPELILWLTERGGVHPSLIRLIAEKLNQLALLEKKGKFAELEEIQANAPNAIPSPNMRTLWRLLITGRIKSPVHNLNLYRWEKWFEHDGLTASLRFELKNILSPKVILRKPIRWPGKKPEKTTRPKSLSELVNWELTLSVDHVQSKISVLTESKRWKRVLPDLLNDFQQLLYDALDLLRELGEADEHSDRSYWDLPSVIPHWQNRGFHDWAVLIELVRDAWLAVQKIDSARASRIAQDWFDLPYPTFKRLALFAASQEKSISPDQWVKWLTDNNGWWLWSVETKRETMRLLVLQGASLTPEDREKLESAILAGPPRSMYRDNIDPDEWHWIVDHSTWLRLAKLQEGAYQLGEAAARRLQELSSAHPDKKLSKHEREEFSHWMSGSGDPDYEEGRKIDIAPSKRIELVEWLKQSPSEERPLHEDTWRNICRKHFANAGAALFDLSKEKIWPHKRWNDAFYAWSENSVIARRSWRCFATLVQSIPDKEVQKVIHGLTWWLREISKVIDCQEDILLELCKRILDLSLELGIDDGDPVFIAINHPVGHITEALLNLCFKRQPNDNEGLPEDIRPLFTQLCDNQIPQFRHGRVLLASRLIPLFRVDRQWTEIHLLPLFDWEHNSNEAKAVWGGFLWSPRLYEPLFIALKESFLATASHYEELGKRARQFAALITYAALHRLNGYTSEDFKEAIAKLPQKGLNEVAWALVQALEASEEQRENYWKNRIRPFWHDIWPKSRELISDKISELLALLTIAAREEFPDALERVINWLKPIEHADYIVDRLLESGLVQRFPDEALCLLDAIIGDQTWPPSQLKKCLDGIEKSKKALLQDNRFKRLKVYIARHDI